jgi:hypothetical protein
MYNKDILKYFIRKNKNKKTNLKIYNNNNNNNNNNRNNNLIIPSSPNLNSKSNTMTTIAFNSLSPSKRDFDGNTQNSNSIYNEINNNLVNKNKNIVNKNNLLPSISATMSEENYTINEMTAKDDMTTNKISLQSGDILNNIKYPNMIGNGDSGSGDNGNNSINTNTNPSNNNNSCSSNNNNDNYFSSTLLPSQQYFTGSN